MQRFLHIASGVFLLYLGWRAGSSWRAKRPNLPEAQEASDHTLFKAVIMNLLSPGAYAYWSLVAGPTLLAGWRNAPASGIAFLLGFYGALVGTLAVIIIAFGTARRFGPRVTHVLLGVSVIALVIFGLYQLSLGILS